MSFISHPVIMSIYMDKRTIIRIGIVTGPTGGHFFPGLAIAEQLREKADVKTQFFVPDRRYIVQWLQKKGFHYKTMPDVRTTIKNPLSFLKLIYLVFCSCHILLKNKYNIVVITGSYATLPFLIASFLCNKKIFVHEQNAIPGKITRVSFFIADRIALSFPSADIRYKKNAVITGFPIPEDFKKRYQKKDILPLFNFSENKRTVLVLGGSQGASFLNNLIAKNMDYLSKKNLQFIHLAGMEKEKLSAEYGRYGIKAQVFDFYFDMAKLYSITDMIVCRAGAGTLAEICEWNIPAIVIPYPYAGGHQKYNALYLAQRGGCCILEQNSDAIRIFPDIFEKALKESDTIKKNLQKILIVDSAGNNVRAIMELCKNGV
ncbi:MAG: UDP-N-acetylglucosamine--N-acetylmuramyl-(pentapeptide) pyrophosphoryl-undecaprenol N-acetylglucosamine transferase [Candidatus Ratteibacteria bacterium]|nr:UDP-N-acetylglucosamine--N-acetylmuramyl-(pentapeptide) pyrophosphoryl-undecaprenol N-acetylglucosamine transferase [Candidatus Ratteibacteria bacterium]